MSQMDPNTVLSELREMTADVESGTVTAHTVEDFAERFAALDGWLRVGGFLPAAWSSR